jgi:hypothetical protein
MGEQKPTLDYGRPDSNPKTRHARAKRWIGAVGVCFFAVIVVDCVRVRFEPGVICFGITTVVFGLVAVGIIR